MLFRQIDFYVSIPQSMIFCIQFFLAVLRLSCHLLLVFDILFQRFDLCFLIDLPAVIPAGYRHIQPGSRMKRSFFSKRIYFLRQFLYIFFDFRIHFVLIQTVIAVFVKNQPFFHGISVQDFLSFRKFVCHLYICQLI